jgi:predicted dehydrogenase
VSRVAVVGLGYWGPNLARNFDELGELAWLCDLDDDLRRRFADRYQHARTTADFADVLADDTVDGVVLSTPVATHYTLSKQALQAGKHVLVEKPPAMRAAEVEELVAIAEERELVLMPGHLLLYHPAVHKLKQLVDSGELGEVLCVYGNRQNLGKIRKDENALWSLGVHDLSVILYLLDEDPEVATAQGSWSIHEGVEDVVFCYLRFPSGKIAHMHLSWLDPHKMRKMTVVGREKMAVFDDMEPDRKVTVYEKKADSSGAIASGDIHIPKVATTEPLRLECEYFLELIDGRHDRAKVARDGARVVRALEMLTNSLDRG